MSQKSKVRSPMYHNAPIAHRQSEALYVDTKA